MASKQLAKGLKRSALTVALGLCFAGGVQAQSSVGSIFGDTASNTTVTIENAALDRTGKPEAGATRDTWLIVADRKEKLTLR